MNAALPMDPAARRNGIVTVSSGNHGQVMAAATHMLGMPVLVAVPEDAPAIKVESAKRWGAEILFFDRHGTDRDEPAARLAAGRRATLIPPFEHPGVIAGQGTVALELVEDAKAAGVRVDVLAVPTGGGGLIGDCALGAVALAAVLTGRLDARGRVMGVVASGGNVDPTLFTRALADG